MVTGAPRWRFYAGMPLRSPDGFNVGALCVADRQPRQLRAIRRKRCGSWPTK